MQLFIAIITHPFVLLGKLFTAIFGEVKWSMPKWLTFLVAMGRQSPFKLIVMLGLIFGLCLLVFKAYDYYKNRPVPTLVEAIISPLAVNADDNDTTQNAVFLPPLTIEFSYTRGAENPSLPDTPEPPIAFDPFESNLRTSLPLVLPSVAPIDLIGGKINSGIRLSPSKAGVWTWQDDRTLMFAPETPWPAGQEYEVHFSPDVFDTQDKFTSNEYSFTTAALTGNIVSSEFELSVEEKRKQVFVEIHFNYPVDAQSVKDSLVIAYQNEAGELGQAQDYTMSISENLRHVSAVMTINELPNEPRIVNVKVNKGVKSIYGGNATDTVIDTKIMVPDLYSYLTLEESSIDILRDPQNEPQQFVLLSFTDAISRDELLSKFSLYLLPNSVTDKKNGRSNSRKTHWQSPRQITNEVLQSARKLDFLVMPYASENNKNYQIKVDVAPGRQLYLKVDAGLRSANGFIQRAFFDQILMAPQYPQEVVISGDGSILTHSNDQRLAFSTRGILDVQVSIGKVIDAELYHLVSQTHGDIKQPNFHNWQFNETNLAQFTTQYINMNANLAKLQSASFASVDLNQLMDNDNGGLGLFFVEIKGWDKKRNRQIRDVSDKLLVLVTNLGVIVKTSQDQSQDVFVQSIQSGKPIKDAIVELIAKNGTRLFRKITDHQGHATFPSTSGFENAEEPVVYVVKQNGDVSFIPYNRYTRQINYSRFDVGGEYVYRGDGAGIDAYMFTDRGIYRPGETVNIGMIVKGEDLQNLGNIPLELVVRDAQYNEIFVEKISLPEFGFTDAKFITEKSFVTGSYSATLHLVRASSNNRQTRDRQIGSLIFEVEEFQADTMSITSKISDIPSKGWAIKPKLVNEVTLGNLFGVPAQNRNVTSTMNIRPMQFSFDEYEDVAFYLPKTQDEPNDGLQSISEELPTQLTNADGQASISIDLARFTQGTYGVNIQTKGFEASGGRSVATSASFLYSPASYLVGHKANGKLDFINLGSQRALSFIAIDNTLSAIALGDLRKRLRKVQNVSTLVKQYNGRYQYESIEKYDLVDEQAYSLPAGYETLDIDTSEAGTFVLELLNADSQVISSVKYTIVGQSNEGGQLDKNAELKITLNQRDYQIGDTIELSIQAPYAGSGLISIESDKLHAFKWFTSPTKSSIQSITIPSSIEGNAYVNVALVRDLASKEIFTSPLSYAVEPFSIDRSKRTLDIGLTVADVVQPGKPMNIGLTLSEDAKVAVFAVDLGILQVANYSTPNPLAHFFKKQALNVRTMQILDLILPDFALTQLLSAAGGDMAQADLMRAEMMQVSGSRAKRSANPFERKVQDPAVFWSGVVQGSKGNNSYTFDVPNDFAGALRVMAIAVGDSAIGRTQQNSIVRGPFVLSPSVLNQAAPGDEFEVTLNVANVVKDSPKNALINIRAKTSEHITIVGADNAQLNLSENQEGAVRFSLKATEILGAANIEFDVNMTGANGQTWQSTRSASLSIRPAMPYSVTMTTGASNSGGVSLKTHTALFAPESTQIISASASPLVIAQGLSAYLQAYPHGCTEQIVSQVFPLVGLSALPQYDPNNGPNNEKVSAYFTELISTLAQRQSYTGGFSYWPSDNTHDIDTSVYVMHFLIEAQALGYAVPQDMLQSGLRYLNDTAAAYFTIGAQSANANASLRNLRTRANVIYLLTRSGNVTTNLLIDLVSTLDKQHKSTWKQDIASGYIAASYHLLQQSKEANELIRAYDLRDQALMVDQAFSGLASRITLDAQYIYLLAKHFEPMLYDLAPQAMLNITQAIYKGEYNTVSAAYSMLALGAYHRALILSNNPSAQVGNSKNTLEEIDKTITFLANSPPQQSPLEVSYSPFASASYPIGTQSVEANFNGTLFANNSSHYNNMYYVNLQAGYPRLTPTEAQNNGIEVQKSFLNKDGDIATNIKQGDELTVRLRMRATNKDTIADIALVDLLPGGFEVIRQSLERSSSPWRSDYIDVREDRIVFYGDITNRITQIDYKVSVTAAGTFTVPPSFVEAMYDRSLQGYSASSTLTVEAQ